MSSDDYSEQSSGALVVTCGGVGKTLRNWVFERLPHVTKGGPSISPSLSHPFFLSSLPQHPIILCYVYALPCGLSEWAGTSLLI